jgi:NADPH:quinone reductase-like Zn-dependent oxidoreductase
MKVYQLKDGFGINALKVAEIAEPVINDYQVLIRVRAVSLNYRDLLIVKGLYPGKSLPLIPMSDGAGEVVAVGERVTRFKTGDRVAGIFMQSWIIGAMTAADKGTALGGEIDGMFAEFVALDESGAVKIPDNLSFEEASTLPCAAVTAWNALFETGNLKPGDKVLTLGTGGVSVFAAQFAHAAGAEVIITSSSDEKLQRAQKELGAKHIINYRATPDWGNGRAKSRMDAALTTLSKRAARGRLTSR